MKTYGTKIVAILVTVMCLIGISPLLVSAATEEIYHPATVAITPNMRYSYSSKAYVVANGRTCITIPFEVNNEDLVISFNTAISNNGNDIVLNLDYIGVKEVFNVTPSTEIRIVRADLPITKGYLVINDNQGTGFPNGLEISINGSDTTVVYGSYTEAEFPYYESIEIPDPPQSNDIATNILDMWHNIISQNSHNLTQFYDDLTGGIALLLCVPIVLAIIGIIYRMIGGRK